MLQAMQAELNREKDAIVLPGMQHPYFMEYRLEDIVSYDAQSSYGALTGEDQVHQKVVRVSVRIGSFASDNSGGRGDGSVQLGPEDNDPADLRYALWYRHRRGLQERTQRLHHQAGRIEALPEPGHRRRLHHRQAGRPH